MIKKCAMSKRRGFSKRFHNEARSIRSWRHVVSIFACARRKKGRERATRGKGREAERKSSARCFNEVSSSLRMDVHFARTPAFLALKITQVMLQRVADTMGGLEQRKNGRRARRVDGSRKKKQDQEMEEQ